MDYPRRGPFLSTEVLHLLDGLDSELERKGGNGVLATDQYEIHTGGPSNSDTSLGLVCVEHPPITKNSVFRGGVELDDAIEERLGETLREWIDRVGTLIGENLDEFVNRTEPRRVRASDPGMPLALVTGVGMGRRESRPRRRYRSAR